jgi:hypothetical protein
LTCTWQKRASIISIGSSTVGDVELGAGQVAERRVERGGLAGAGRARDEDQSVRAGDPLLEALALGRREAEVLEVGHQHARVEHAHDDLLAERGRHARHAQLHLALGALVLIRPSCGRRRSAMFMPASTLIRDDDRAVHGKRQRLDVVQDPVDPEPDHRVLRARLEVQVRGALLEGVVEQVVDRGDHVLVVRVAASSALLRSSTSCTSAPPVAPRPSWADAWVTFDRKP